ncbi:MAG: Nif3-like dinuclear metal center hexameric protein [Sphingobacteriales bacterium]|nr:MAG: Nif3-like dinuclear metal center hexameric protein [Sphingobacteriales bacterium]
MLVKDIIQAIEAFAPAVYQESYDNSGLQVGDPNMEVTGVLLTLDVTEAIVAEAMERNCNMIVAHHPLLFSGLKRISGRNYVERVVIKTIKHDIAIYAAHTNLDNVHNGVNARIAAKLGLKETSVLMPMTSTLRKLHTFVPAAAADKVRDAMFAAGAGSVGAYKECSYNVAGSGTFKPGADTHPAIGTPNGPRETVDEVKIEVLIGKHNEHAVLKAMMDAHPYEDVAYDIVALNNINQELGAGMIGKLKQPLSEADFLSLLKSNMKADCIRHTALAGKKVEKIAICGGSGSFLLKDAINAGADVFVTADFKYHQFFDAEGKIVIADIGHYETEQFTVEIFEEILKDKFRNFAILLSNLSTNPVNYFC